MNSELSEYRIEPLPTNLALRLDKPLFWLRKFCSLVVDELHSTFRLPWRQRLRAWRLGYTTKSFVMYRLDQNDPGEYVSEFVQKVKTHKFNGRYNSLIDDKLSFSLLFERCGAPHPPVLGIIRRGSIYPLDATGAATSGAWLQRQIAEEQALVIKPLTGFKGKGFAVIKQAQSGFLVNGVEASQGEIERLIEMLDDYYVSGFITQANYARKLYPDTTNTIRLLTYWDRSTNNPFIAMAVHRIGTERSYPVDNWKSGLGGLSARIDIETGKLGPAVNVTPQGRLAWHDAHPETGNPIAGVTIPRWIQLKEEVLDLARRLAFLPDIAWDCVITDEGFSFLELNGASALFVFQIHEPLLRDPRVRAFYQMHGLIK